VVHFISRVPRGLKVVTPFVNGTVEGTEFVFDVNAERAVLSVFEGRVRAQTARDNVVVEREQEVVARPGHPLTTRAIVSPTDAVQWALHYPLMVDHRYEDFGDLPGETWPAAVRRSIEAYRRGDVVSAFAEMDTVPLAIADPGVVAYRATLLLTVGRVEEAIKEIRRLPATDARRLAVESTIAVVRNDKEEALRTARAAVQARPGFAAAWLSALSHAEQAHSTSRRL
jgi:hypothetical protein